MKKRSAIILSMMLLLVMLTCVGCAAKFMGKKNTGSGADDAVSLSTGDVADTNVLLNFKPTDSIGVYALNSSVKQVKSKVSVKDANGDAVDFDVVGGDNAFYGIVSGAYKPGLSYTIEIGKGMEFSEKKYAAFTSLDIIIAKEQVEDIRYREGIISLEEGAYAKMDNSTIMLANNDNDIAVDSVIMIDIANGKKEAYVVNTITKNGGGIILGVKDAEAEQVFENIDVNKDMKMEEGSIELNEEELIAQLEEGQLSALVIDLGFVKPTITVENFGIDLATNSLRIDIVFTIPLDGSGYTNFKIRVANVVKVDPSVNYSTAPFSFNLTAKMNIVTTTTFQITAGYSESGMYDANEIAQKLAALTKQPISEAALRVFKWSYPIGPLFISYELDFFFNISIAGEATLTGVSEANYVLGAYYNDGKFKAIAEKGEKKDFQLTNAELYGSAHMNAGIRNTLALELLQIVRVGIQIDLGAYLDIYGAVKFNLDDIKQTNAGFYLDFGLFYDVGVLAGCDILGIIKIQEKINIANGRLQLLEVGEKVMNVDYTDDVKDVTIYSKSTVIPSLVMKKYNLINRSIYTEEIAFEDSEYTLPENAFFTLENGVITVKDDAPNAFEQNIIVTNKENKQIKHTLTVKRLSDVPHATVDILNYDKGENNVVSFDLVLKGGEFLAVSGEGIATKNYTFNGTKLTIDYRFLAAKANGMYKFVVENTKQNFNVFVRVGGTISMFAEGKGSADNAYILYAQEQIIEFVNSAALNSNYSGIYFKLDADIDMRGVTLAPITLFQGSLTSTVDANKNPNNYKLYNFNIGTVEYNGETLGGFIGINKGTLANFTISANMTIDAQIVKAGLIAAINEGNIVSCVADGNISVSYRTTPSRHSNLVVGGMVGVNNKGIYGGTSTPATVSGNLKVKSYGTSIKSTIYAANLVGFNRGTIGEHYSIQNTLTNESNKIGHTSYINGVANS